VPWGCQGPKCPVIPSLFAVVFRGRNWSTGFERATAYWFHRSSNIQMETEEATPFSFLLNLSESSWHLEQLPGPSTTFYHGLSRMCCSGGFSERRCFMHHYGYVLYERDKKVLESNRYYQCTVPVEWTALSKRSNS
jgi:hypothetical protein